jgi:hypothetical protein
LISQSRGLGDVYKRQVPTITPAINNHFNILKVSILFIIYNFITF